jgi:hypothetical protein
VSRDPVLNPIDGVDSRGRRTVNAQVDSQDGVAIPINVGGQEATRYCLSRQRWNRATLLTTTAYGSRAIISA